MKAFLGALSSYYSLELFIRDIEESGKRLFHYGVRQWAVQLNIAPFVSIRPEDILAEETTINRLEGLLGVCICRFHFSGACQLIDILVGESEDLDSFSVPLDVKT